MSDLDIPDNSVRASQNKSKPRRLSKGMYILPSLFTTANIGFGYYAILQITHGSAVTPAHFDYAAKAIGLAFICDGLDGRIARITGTSSDFGKELDSLADVITFGVAPAMLAWMWGFQHLTAWSTAENLSKLVQLGGIASFLFLMAGREPPGTLQHYKEPSALKSGPAGQKVFRRHANSGWGRRDCGGRSLFWR